MASVVIDGITTRYEVVGSGEPLLMFSPGGFDATLEKWTTLGIYAKTRMLDHLVEQLPLHPLRSTRNGPVGRPLERVTWNDYAAQGQGPARSSQHRHARICSAVAWAAPRCWRLPSPTPR